MVSARMSVWKFKRGMREKGFNMLEQSVADVARKTRGYRGSLTLLSTDDPDSGIIICLWESEDALKASAKGVFQDAVKKLEQFVAAPPDVKNYKVDSAELLL